MGKRQERRGKSITLSSILGLGDDVPGLSEENLRKIAQILGVQENDRIALLESSLQRWALFISRMMAQGAPHSRSRKSLEKVRKCAAALREAWSELTPTARWLLVSQVDDVHPDTPIVTIARMAELARLEGIFNDVDGVGRWADRALEQQGPAPRHRPRSYYVKGAVFDLALLYRRITGRKPTCSRLDGSGPLRGRFAKFSHVAFSLLGRPPAGLDTAIQEATKKMKVTPLNQPQLSDLFDP